VASRLLARGPAQERLAETASAAKASRVCASWTPFFAGQDWSGGWFDLETKNDS
jgi:hypothetical protein